jgi:hypothetical protein
VVNDETKRDVYLDAVALIEARHRDDEEGFNAILAAADGRPWYL